MEDEPLANVENSVIEQCLSAFEEARTTQFLQGQKVCRWLARKCVQRGLRIAAFRSGGCFLILRFVSSGVLR